MEQFAAFVAHCDIRGCHSPTSVVGLAGVAAIVEHAENPGRGTEYSRYVHMKSGASDNFPTAAPKSNVPRTVLTLDPGRKMDGIAVFQPCSSDCLFP